MFLVTYMATREEKNELLKTFQSLDVNGDGQLNREELINGNSKDYWQSAYRLNRLSENLEYIKC